MKMNLTGGGRFDADQCSCCVKPDTFYRKKRKVMNLAALRGQGLCRYVVILIVGMHLVISLAGSVTAAPYKSKQIRVEYVPSKNPAHQDIYERLKQARALER